MWIQQLFQKMRFLLLLLHQWFTKHCWWHARFTPFLSNISYTSMQSITSEWFTVHQTGVNTLTHPDRHQSPILASSGANKVIIQHERKVLFIKTMCNALPSKETFYIVVTVLGKSNQQWYIFTKKKYSAHKTTWWVKKGDTILLSKY